MSEDTNEEQDAIEGYHAAEQCDVVIILAVVKIAGLQHYIASDSLARFRSGDCVELRLEPSNPHDNKAVEVLWKDSALVHGPSLLKAGYIPKPLAQAIFALIAAEYDLSAEITEDGLPLITISMKQ